MSTTKNSRDQKQDVPPMPPMSFVEHLVAYVTLGLLCGTYQISLILFPVLFGWSYYASFTWHPSTVVLAILITISLIPINHRPQVWFLKSGIWKIWHKYFHYKTDLSLIQGKLEPSERYLFWEGPHGIWPMGQFLSCPFIPTITGAPFETKFIFGTGAGIIFNFPGVRHVMSWIGTHVVSRKSFTKIFKEEGWAAVVAGGIAEMYLGTATSEGLYIKRRYGTVKMAIQEGAHIIPAFFFGNSRCFTIVGGSDASGKDASFLAKFLQRVSRALKASIVFFYGRNYLPIPFRTPLKMVAGNVVRVKQNDNPSDEEIQAVLNQVMNEFERLYADESKRPIWETRPLKLH